MRLPLASIAAGSLVATSARATQIWRYTSGEDVLEHTKIDLDMAILEERADAGDYAGAFSIWADGANSASDATTLRTLKGFSTGLVAKAAALQSYNGDLLSEYALFTEYYGADDTYGATFVEHAINGSGPFTDLPLLARAELIAKGAQYQVVHMYVLRELYEALRTCLEGGVAVKAWDEGVAFYTGSLIQPDGSGSGALLYTFAQKRCGAFGTCEGDGTAATNARAFDAFVAGKAAVLEGRCADVQGNLQVVRKQMQVALMQGVLYYTLKSDEAISPVGDVTAAAETWAFIAALLPYIDAVDADAASSLRAELEMKTGTTHIAQSGYAGVFETVYGVLPKLCMSCEEIGVNDVVFSGASIPVCVTDREALEAGCAEYLRPLEVADEEENTDWGLIIGIACAALVLAGVMFFGVWRLSKAGDEQDRAHRAAKQAERDNRYTVNPDDEAAGDQDRKALQQV